MIKARPIFRETCSKNSFSVVIVFQVYEQNMALIVLFLALLSLSNGLKIDIERRCDKINPELTGDFNENIAHTIHSMTVQGLRLFNPRVTEKNIVPTVNHNVSAPNLVVPYAPDDTVGKNQLAMMILKVFKKRSNGCSLQIGRFSLFCKVI